MSESVTPKGYTNITEYKFSELFDLNEIQKLQDLFSAATGVASIITEPDGTPITEPSGFCSLCNEIVRKTEKGLKNCLISDSIIGSPAKDGPKIQRCLSGGLIDGGASISVEGKHIANWLIGQVLDEDYELEDLLPYADVIGANRDVYRNELLKVKRMSKLQFENICNFLFLYAQQISQYAIKTIYLKHEINEKIINEIEIINLNSELEMWVRQRTTQLEESNAELEKKFSEQKLVEKALKESEQFLRESQKVAHLGSYVIELKTGKWKGTAEINEIFGINETYPHTLEGWIDCIHPDCRAKFLEYYLQVETEKQRFDYEYKIIRINDGKERWVHGLGEIEYDDQSDTVRMIGIIQDITDRKKTENELIYLSYHDKLTGLYNRRFYEEEIKRLDTERNLPISIIMGDVNGLKIINDSFGHDKGDELLQKAAAAIKGACRTDDIVARWGGDEFIILLPKTNIEEAEEIVKRVKDLYSTEYVNAIPVSISFGWDTKKKADEDILKVLKSTEDYMYEHKILENQSMRGNTIGTIINTLHEKNPREEQHSKRVSELCQKIGIAIGASEIEISKLKVLGLLHDIGKIAIEEGILNKSGKLTEQEWDEIKKHPDIGYRILNSSHEMPELAEGILAHHERWDGTGYPKGLKGEAIPRVARIIALADSYDAMTSERPYRNALSEEEVLAEIRINAGIQFDPEIARLFIEKVLNKPWN